MYMWDTWWSSIDGMELEKLPLLWNHVRCGRRKEPCSQLLLSLDFVSSYTKHSYIDLFLLNAARIDMSIFRI
jgi:hypothetical protein